MRRLYSCLVVLAFAITAGGCATLFSSGDVDVRMESEPSGATVATENGRVLGTTPFTASLDEDEEYLLIFSKEGYEDSRYPLDKKVDPTAFLNLLNVLFWGIDFATGAVWTLEDDYVRVALQEATAGLDHEELIQFACNNYHAVHARDALGTAEKSRLYRAIRSATSTSYHKCGVGF